jgi:hypothetical protein
VDGIHVVLTASVCTEIGLKREALLDRRCGVCVRGELATPNSIGVNDAASEPRHPTPRSDDVIVLTICGGLQRWG